MQWLQGGWLGPASICAVGTSLTTAHLTHATEASGSLSTFLVGSLFPALVSSGVLIGGLWLWQSAFTATARRRVGTWCVIGGVAVSLNGFLTLFFQHTHGVQLADRVFIVLNSASFGSLLGFVVGVYDAQRYRHKRLIQTREQALDRLHTTTRTFIQSSDQQQIATWAVEATHEILQLPINTCWLYDEAEDVLTPVAATDEATELVGELPTYTGDESLSWEAFETGDIMLYNDVRDAPERHNTETPIRSEIILPLGEYGVMNIGSTETGAFDEIDVSLVSLLAANTQTALERAEREEQLATTRDQVTQLNHQLTVFNRVLRHDLRNTANVMHGHADVLVETATDDTITTSARTIRNQAAALVDMSDQAEQIERLLDDEWQTQTTVEIVDVITTRLDRIERDYPSVQTDGPACDTCYVTAHPLIHSAIFNVIKNAVEHNDADTPQIDVTLSRADDCVTIRIADNGPGIPDDEVAVLERGYETPLEHTSGLGLWLVNWIVHESEGALSFTANEPRGSIVCLELDRATPETQSAEQTAHH